jgi:hypothetical protein
VKVIKQFAFCYNNVRHRGSEQDKDDSEAKSGLWLFPNPKSGIPELQEFSR